MCFHMTSPGPVRPVAFFSKVSCGLIWNKVELSVQDADDAAVDHKLRRAAKRRRAMHALYRKTRSKLSVQFVSML